MNQISSATVFLCRRADYIREIGIDIYPVGPEDRTGTKPFLEQEAFEQ